MGLSADAAAIDAALEACRFERLQAQEAERGFREKAPRAASFFRRGEAGGWRDDLTPDLVAQIVQNHAPMMRRFGYLDEAVAWLETHPAPTPFPIPP